MPRTRQHILGERPLRRRHLSEGTVITEEGIQRFLADYEKTNRTKDTVQFYRRKLQRLYEVKPSGMARCRRGRSRCWRAATRRGR